jgi:PAS domain S-box-containing protein
LNTHYKSTFVALAFAFTGGCALLFGLFYREAKNNAITKLHEEQRIHAKQAARGIENFFATWTRTLDALAKMDEVADNDAVGQRLLKLFYEANQEQIMSITRLDERGVIIHNFPAGSSVGTDISGQKHVRELLRDHQPVISDVFRAVEGVDAIALHVPVFRGAEFKGSVGILVNFESLAKRYLDVIQIGETGYAWVVSRDGTILYSPIPGFTGKSVWEVTGNFASLIAMENDMLKGREGTAIYTFDRIGDRNVGQTRKYAVYMPVQIGNTFWSIAVASAEQDVLSGLISFRNKLALVVGALFLCGMVFSTLGAKAWFIVKEEEKRKLTEEKLQESEQRFRQVTETAGEFIWEVDAAGLYTFASPSVEKILGYTAEELVGKLHFYDLFVPSVREERKAAAFRLFAARQSFRNFPNPNVSKSGRVVHLETSGAPVLDPAEELVGYRGADADVTGRRNAEAAARELGGRLINAQENERRRIARDLHDDLSQRLALISVELELFGQEPPAQPEAIAGRMQRFSGEVKSLSSEIHRLAHELHPAKLEQLGLAATVRGFCKELAAAHEFAIEFEPRDVPTSLPNEVALCLYRITQEALQNVVKHSGATSAKVELAATRGELHLIVTDDGHGFDPQAMPDNGSLGIVSMRERVRMVQGQISVQSRPGEGTRVEVRVPIAPPAGEAGG